MNGVTTHTDASVLRIVLDRPVKRNAVNTSMLRELAGAIATASTDAVRVVALSGAGQAFCAGGDLSGVDTEGAVIAANEVVQAITQLPKPVVAGVRGAAAGFGCSLALSCDLVIAARSAFFQLSFTKVGLMPDGGASALLPAAIGRARAARMALLAEKIPATDAFDWGMISHVVDDVAFDDEVESVLQALAAGPTASYGWTKRALTSATLPDLTGAQVLEAQGQQALTQTEDFRHRVRAFRRGPRPGK
ncbi:enoyl-CoA hydratase/isomerase family protein [Mycobacterium sp. SMC-2]|uniref:enoyl-CoA hydratase-related protein n=1 Tax=Mycobacterium TaxID=1763 RepID=UPI001CE18A47|nr:MULTISPECIES: enoyl-CoA hydratase-related protein [Mycobacterium]MCA4759102.1 enoyl-CoA hydratase/isomerase family protein [Mycobacterium avium subsp. hominissuis]UXA06473.1 enoyl-CoA hydratase/isomerase family protein [Mycobacterium sp. SMC-2]